MLLIGLYCYLHIYLQRLWEGLASLPAVFPDGRTLDERAYPWLLSGLVQAHVPRLRRNRPSLSRAQVALSIVFAWAFVPLTLLGFWGRYLPRHDLVGALWLLALFVGTTGAGFVFYGLARSRLRHPVKEVVGPSSVGAKGLVAYLAIVGGCLSFAVSFGGAPYKVFGFELYADLADAEISQKPSSWTGLEDNLETELALVKGAKLAGANLRFAQATGAFLAQATLVRANLQDAHLDGAKLQGADLRRANLQGATLRDGNLYGAELREVKFQGADLRRANLQGVDFFRADLQRVEFFSADLQGASLYRANLEGVRAREANFHGADLFDADVRGVDLFSADLQETNFYRAHLELASLHRANLLGADLRRADLLGTELRGAKLQEADLSTAKNLTQAQLDEACGDADTKLPSGLTIQTCEEYSADR